jgi:hypothetical protein
MDFPQQISTELVAAMGYTPVLFTRIAMVLSKEGVLKVNPHFKAASNIGYALQRERTWHLTAPLVTGFPLREWDEFACPTGAPLTGRVQNDEQNGWARNSDGTFKRAIITVDGTTGYRIEQVSAWEYKVWKPLVHEESKGEFYDVDMLVGTCNCPQFLKKGASVDRNDPRIKVGCKHIMRVWLQVVLGK